MLNDKLKHTGNEALYNKYYLQQLQPTNLQSQLIFHTDLKNDDALISLLLTDQKEP